MDEKDNLEMAIEFRNAFYKFTKPFTENWDKKDFYSMNLSFAIMLAMSSLSSKQVKEIILDSIKEAKKVMKND